MPSFVLTLSALFLFNTLAQQSPAKAPPSMTVGSPEIERLGKALVGQWDTVETMVPDKPWPRGASRIGVVTTRIASGGYTLVYEVHSDGSAGKLDGFLTIWWDREAKLYHVMVCFNHPKSPCRMRGIAHWEGDAFVNDYDLTMNGEKTTARDTFTFAPGSYRLVAAVKSGGIMRTMITTDAKRVSAAMRPAISAPGSAPISGQVSAGEFNALMERLERAWNSNDAGLAADCFAENAIFSSPPSPRLRQGRAALFEFFGGRQGRPRPMHIEWHHLVFDQEQQIGAGEYTFSYDIQTHGIVIVKISDGKIANWREYEVESPASWEEMIGANKF